MRVLYVTLLVLTALVLAVPAGAKRPAEPTKLWSQYPLEPKTRQAAPVPTGPLLPPTHAEPPIAVEGSDWSPWIPLAVAGAIAGTIALLFAAGSVRPAAAPGGNVVDRGVRALAARAQQLRARVPAGRRSERVSGRPRARSALRPYKTGPNAQYAPRWVVEPEPEQSVPYITRRSGLVRSRYVVMIEEPDGERELRRSKAFWQLGPEAWQRRMGEDAWDRLANDLRADGWEVDATGRYEYFVPLRRAIVSTLAPYTRRERNKPPPDHA